MQTFERQWMRVSSMKKERETGKGRRSRKRVEKE